jgi:hypothetical protein
MCGKFDFYQKGGCMYSQEFMKFLINYQKPEFNDSVNKQVKYFNLNTRGNKLASILLLIKK